MKRNYLYLDNEDDTEVNMTPMLDIVFIMLIFFIVTTSFVKESGISVNRPTAQTAVRQERGNILISINNLGEIWIDKRQVDILAVRPNVERLHVENPEGSVVIVSDKKSETGILIQVIDQVRLAGIENVSLAANKAE